MGFNLIQAQIGKVLEAELSGSSFRFRDPIPEVIKDWFDEDDLYLYFSTECVAEGQRNNYTTLNRGGGENGKSK